MAFEFAFASACHSQQNWVWFPGWGFNAEVFTELAHGLPGQHYWYRWGDEKHFDQAVDDLCQTLPDQAILVGWSLGGALAEAAAHHQPAPKALITLATPDKFCRSPEWPYGMPHVRFEGFVNSLKQNPHKTQVRFLALNAQGTDKPKSVIGLLSAHQLDASEALLHQLLWLDQYDFTTMKKAPCPCLHLFAEHDALVAPPHNHGQGHYELIAGAGHALFIHQPDIIRDHVLHLYRQLDHDLRSHPLRSANT